MDLNKTFSAVQYASRKLLALNDEKITQILLAVADAAEKRADFILAENRKDLDRMDISNPKYDRLKLTADRLKGIADDIRKVAKLPSPVGRVQKQAVMPNGLKIKRVSVPFGVIGIIYEARPNVSFDVFSLCLKSGNACILKGGSDADASNRAIISVIHDVLKQFEVDLHVVELLPSDREATAALLHANGYVDLIIPRGSSNLINFVRQNATIPVIETGAGICHTFFDRYGERSRHRQQRQDAPRQRMQCFGLPARRRRPHERPARPLCTAAGKQCDYLRRYACIRLFARPLSGGTAERSHGRGFRYGISGLQTGCESR